jgi:hypothetical protein
LPVLVRRYYCGLGLSCTFGCSTSFGDYGWYDDDSREGESSLLVCRNFLYRLFSRWCVSALKTMLFAYFFFIRDTAASLASGYLGRSGGLGAFDFEGGLVPLENIGL